jgi:hypothetical protein
MNSFMGGLRGAVMQAVSPVFAKPHVRKRPVTFATGLFLLSYFVDLYETC